MIPELIVGAVVSIVVQIVKKTAKTNKLKTLVILVVVSILGAIAYNFLQHLGYWEAFVTVLVTASGIYALLTGGMKALK